MRLAAPQNLVFHLHLYLHLHLHLHLHDLLPGWSCQRSAAWLILPTGWCLVDPSNGLLLGWSWHNLRANERPKKNFTGRGQSPTHSLTQTDIATTRPKRPKSWFGENKKNKKLTYYGLIVLPLFWGETDHGNLCFILVK